MRNLHSYLNFFEAQVRELDVERNQSIITSILEPLQVQDARLEEGKLPIYHQCQYLQVQPALQSS